MGMYCCGMVEVRANVSARELDYCLRDAAVVIATTNEFQKTTAAALKRKGFSARGVGKNPKTTNGIVLWYITRSMRTRAINASRKKK